MSPGPTRYPGRKLLALEIFRELVDISIQNEEFVNDADDMKFCL
jgi:hypothetical protein